MEKTGKKSSDPSKVFRLRKHGSVMHDVKKTETDRDYELRFY